MWFAPLGPTGNQPSAFSLVSSSVRFTTRLYTLMCTHVRQIELQVQSLVLKVRRLSREGLAPPRRRAQAQPTLVHLIAATLGHEDERTTMYAYAAPGAVVLVVWSRSVIFT